MKKLTFIIALTFLMVSCNKDNISKQSYEQTVAEHDLTQVFHYKGKSYELNFVENEAGELEMTSVMPSALKNLDELENLAIEVDGNNIYLFDTEKLKFDYFKLDYSLLLKSRLKENQNNLTARFDPNSFNINVKAFDQNSFTGTQLYVSSFIDMKDLNRVGFTDVMSSVAVNTKYVPYPQDGDRVVFYEHSNFRGRSLSFTNFTNTYNLGDGKVYVGHHKFRNLKLKGWRKWADKVSSIDVLRYNRSIVF